MRSTDEENTPVAQKLELRDDNLLDQISNDCVIRRGVVVDGLDPSGLGFRSIAHRRCRIEIDFFLNGFYKF